jgi:hypothetical protein
MRKRRGSVADGVKAVYHVQQAFEAVQSLNESKVRKFFEELASVAMMLVAVAFVCGLFWLANLAIHALKNLFL